MGGLEAVVDRRVRVAVVGITKPSTTVVHLVIDALGREHEVMAPPPYGLIAHSLKNGEVVVFLGAGASAAYRDDEEWQPGKSFLPLGGELSRFLASESGFPDPTRSGELALVASYVEHVAGDRTVLNGRLRHALCLPCAPGDLHKLLARIAVPLLVVTTNYDDLAETALAPKNPYVVIDRGDARKIWVSKDGAPPEPVRPELLREVLRAELRSDDPDPFRPIVYKMHGTLDRANSANDAFLVTEQDYVDFLGRAGGYVPGYINSLMLNKGFLFFGYSLTDWNVRVLLHKLRKPKDKAAPRRSWAFRRSPEAAEREIWKAHRVNIYDVDLHEAVRNLDEAVRNLEQRP